MAGNPVPDDRDNLLALAEDLADGAHAEEAAIGIQHNKETQVRASIAAFRTAEAAHDRAKKERQDAREVLALADEVATMFLGKTRKVLANFLGNFWSQQWEPTGFPDQSTAVPTTQEKRLNLCASLQIHFTTVPAHEVAAMGVTAVAAENHFQALSNGRDALASKQAALTAARQARDTAYDALKKRVRDLINELDALLGDNDPRWHAFGLNMPSDPDTPEPVEQVKLKPGTPGSMEAKWPRAKRATRYRPFVQIVGVDQEFVARDAVHDLTVTLNSFTSGQVVRVKVVAANEAGQAPASPVAEERVP